MVDQPPLHLPTPPLQQLRRAGESTGSIRLIPSQDKDSLGGNHFSARFKFNKVEARLESGQIE